MNYRLKDLLNKIKETEVFFFDLDGTLIDTEPLYFRFWKEASRFYGRELSDEEALSMRSRDRTSANEYIRDISGGKLDYLTTRKKRTELMNEYLIKHPIQLKEGAYDLLVKLKQEGKKVYIVTANTVKKSEDIISGLHFMHLLDGIISARDVERGKPFPDVYLKASSVVGLKPKDIIVFEDSPNGLKSSFSAGCFTVLVEDLTPFSEDMDYVDASIKSLKDLL